MTGGASATTVHMPKTSVGLLDLLLLRLDLVSASLEL
jgi:hypothetical protein